MVLEGRTAKEHRGVAILPLREEFGLCPDALHNGIHPLEVKRFSVEHFERCLPDGAKNGTGVDRTGHTTLQEGLSRSIDSLAKDLNYHWSQKKVYLLDYKEDAAGQKKAATEDLLNVLNQGALMTTYFGHGSKTDWAAEGLLKPSYLSRISNTGRYTILNSFSCIVGRFDEGIKRSLSEEFVVAKSAGSIASVGAARETFATNNEKFGKNFVFNLLRNDGITIGEAFMRAKNTNAEQLTS